MPRRWTWWLVLAIYIILLLAGQTAATLLQRFYYIQRGNSKWMQTLTFSAGFPILFILLLLSPSISSSPDAKHSLIKISLAYIAIGLITTADSLMYSYGLLYLNVSTYALVSTTQLAFNAVFSYFINSERFTHLTLNSIILLTFSAAILGVHDDQDPSSSSNISGGKYVLGFMLTLTASATYSFILSLMELTFQKVIKRQTVKAVLEMQIYTALVSTVGAMVGLFASREWRGLRGEMEGFGKGRVAYVMTLVGASVAWQVTNLGLIGLIFQVSSLFSNVISTLGTPIVPVFAVFLFQDKMDGLKIISLLLGLWGFTSYFYQQYIDYVAEKKKKELQESGMAMENEMSAA
ncbi:probable purine permease 11 [Phalaenopsis equestris]|uniref:probable purine permease 11 n=1 Tax=Phalaenopsis equestris TaxID=78828 RepID=UPI0009E29BCB|nr:probable purine permease 11 [Phalaenopsis equestris]XP_020574799.1 probable purine permease 11 [Phalaenopsis equestris]XP_020574800.1 probable purine permease 11 [Phalaenopsis equestris]